MAAFEPETRGVPNVATGGGVLLLGCSDGCRNRRSAHLSNILLLPIAACRLRSGVDVGLPHKSCNLICRRAASCDANPTGNKLPMASLQIFLLGLV